MANKAVKNTKKNSKNGKNTVNNRNVNKDTKKPQKQKKKSKKDEEEQEIIFKDGAEYDKEDMDIFYASRKNIKELVAPLGVNPNPLEYMVIEDNGVSLYTMVFYIHKLPSVSTFAQTYARLYNYEGVTSSTFINPLGVDKSSKQLDKRIVILDGEQVAAEKEGDRNRFRKITDKMHNAESYAKAVESGNNQLYEVAFIFVLQAETLDKLRFMASEFHILAREKGIEMHSCYSVHPEAFLSGYPTNKVFKAQKGVVKNDVVKWHILDKFSLCDIFNHTRSGFSHKDGIFAGRDMKTGQPITIDVYDESHDGYGVIICGKTGTGKSATIKEFSSRYIDFGYVVRSIDFNPRGSRGEYSIEADAVGGINFQIKKNSDNILNIFELDAESEFDEITGKEYKVLNLSEKIVGAVNLLMVMIKNGKEIRDFDMEAFIEEIVTDAVRDIYEDCGIVDGDVDSLYTTGNILEGGMLTSGKVRKKLPTITDFFKRVLIKQSENKEAMYRKPYRLVVSRMRDYVREVYYCPECNKFFERDEYEKLEIDQDGNHLCECGSIVTAIKGIRPYFDGQSNIPVLPDTPHVNIDISQLQKAERIVALLVAMEFMQENYVKKNSSNVKEARKMILIIDELHMTFPYKEAREFVDMAYRTFRKKNVSTWTATQALADYKGYRETESIIKNSTMIMLMKQDYQDRDFIKQTTPLTDSQVEQVLQLGGDPNDNDNKERKGEMCLIDNQSKVVFMKVDYLVDSESRIVETDMNKILKMYKGSSAVEVGEEH